VTVAVAVSTQTAQSTAFGYNGPSLTSINPSNGPTGGGTLLTLQGSSFATSGGAVWMNQSNCTVVSQTHTKVVCSTPAGSGARQVLFSVGGQNTTTRPFNYDNPTISTVVPASSPTVGGVVVTITGTSLDAVCICFVFFLLLVCSSPHLHLSFLSMRVSRAR
jgi:hypothetical protein